MLALNDVLYYTHIRNEGFNRKRIEYTDAEGLVWHRYSSPSWSYDIKALRIVGRSVVTTSWVDSPLEVEIPEDLYYLENGEQVAVDDVDNGYNWYTNISGAETRIAAHKEQANDIR